MIAAFVTAWVAGTISSKSDVTTAVISVLFASLAAYHWFWKPSGLSDSVEAATG
jgi:hypothetical protein